MQVPNSLFGLASVVGQNKAKSRTDDLPKNDVTEKSLRSDNQNQVFRKQKKQHAEGNLQVNTRERRSPQRSEKHRL